MLVVVAMSVAALYSVGIIVQPMSATQLWIALLASYPASLHVRTPFASKSVTILALPVVRRAVGVATIRGCVICRALVHVCDCRATCAARGSSSAGIGVLQYVVKTVRPRNIVRSAGARVRKSLI